MLITCVASTALVLVCFLIHHDVLYGLYRWLPRRSVPSRYRVALGACGALLAHLLEIGAFGLAYALVLLLPSLGELGGNFNGSLLDCLYFSATTYTSLGLGDIEPLGPIRVLVAIEALIGFMAITWTASFLYVEMNQSWRWARDGGPHRTAPGVR